MVAMSWIWTTFVVVTSALVYYLRRQRQLSRQLPLPPGPRGLPVLGHLHLLGRNPHQDLNNLAKIHGPIMYMRLGFVPTIVVSSPEAAEQFLKTYDLVFAGRPHHEASRIISYGQSNMTFGQYGPYWRNMRKLCTLELLSQMKIDSFKAMRKEQIGLMISSLVDYSSQNGASGVNLSAEIGSLSSDMACLMVFGKKYNGTDIDPRGFKAMVQEIMQMAAAPNLGDFFPYLNVLDFQGLNRRMKEIAHIVDGFLEQIIEEHCHQKDENSTKRTKTFVGTMLSIMESGSGDFQFETHQMKSILLDMFLAGTDTTGTTVEWIFSELLKHPQVMKKLQKELEEVVGMNRMVEESDLEKLEYLDMVLKESLRLHPAGPLLIPHEALEDCTVDGFHIPKKSRIIVNAWGIMRDSKAWPEPERFNPERFAGSSVDVRGRDFQLIPFGSGRRSCPGMHLGLVSAKIVVSQLVHCFDWELPEGVQPSDVDMEEVFGLVMARAKPLMAVPTYRLHTPQLYKI